LRGVRFIQKREVDFLHLYKKRNDKN
jgi:hypothetical protein